MKMQKIGSPMIECSLEELQSSKEIILAINPGSTSTKIGLASIVSGDISGELKLFETSLDVKEKITDFSSGYKKIKKVIIDYLSKNNIKLTSISSICGRGGILKPNAGGIIQINAKDELGNYKINKAIENDLIINPQLLHESNMGALIASSIAEEIKVPAFILDSVTSDVSSEFNKYAGKRGFERRALWHALNVKAVLRSFSSHINKDSNTVNSVIVHLGGGITVAASRNGKIIDTTNALVGEGPMTPKRGIIQAADMIKFAIAQFKKGHTLESIILKDFASNAGIKSYIGTDSLIDLENYINKSTLLKEKNNISELLTEEDINNLLNDTSAELSKIIYKAVYSIKHSKPDITKHDLFHIIKGELAFKVLGVMAYQVAGFIGNFAVKVKMPLDGIVFTGGGANSTLLLNLICEYLQILNTGFFVFPNSLEQWAMVEQTFLAMKKEVKVSSYKSENQVVQGNILNDNFYTKINIKMPSPKFTYPLKNTGDLLEHARNIGKIKPITLAIVKANDSSKKAAELGLQESIISNVVYVESSDVAAALYENSEVHLIMKGALETANFMKPLMKLKKSFYGKINYASITKVRIEGQDKLIFFSDPGITTGLDEFTLIEMIKNVSYLAKNFAIEPKVALLSASENASPKINLSVESEKISNLPWDFIVDGPISYDIAMSKKAASNKGYPGPIQGDANILMHMDINSANIYYKHLLLSEKKSINDYVAGAVIGLPVVLASREATKEEKLLTLSLSVVLSQIGVQY